MSAYYRALATGLIVAATFGFAAGPLYAESATPTPAGNAAAVTTPAAPPIASNAAAKSAADQETVSTKVTKHKVAHAMSRHRVEQIQTALATNGGNLAVDGDWGPKTAAALVDFQKQHKLKATGKLDRETVRALNLDASKSL